MSRYRRNSYSFSGFNYGYGLGSSLFRSSRHKRRNSKNSLEYGFFMLVVGLVFLVAYGGKSGQANVLSIVDALKPLIIVLVILYGSRFIYQEYQRDKLSKTGIFDIDKMTGTAFEERLCILYSHLGYHVEHIGKTGDAGVDLIIEKNGHKTAIQAKRYDGNVGEAAVQQVHTGKTFYHCDDAIIVTNSHFTDMARKVAKATHVTLMSRDDLIKTLEEDQAHRNTQQPSWVDNAASWLARRLPLEKVNTVQTTEPGTSVPEREQNQKRINPELLKYISYYISSGEKWTDLKVKLRQGGWRDEILDAAFFQLYNSNAQQNQHDSTINPELLNYISNHISLNEKWADLKVKLREKGWKDEVLNDAFFQLYSSQAQKPE